MSSKKKCVVPGCCVDPLGPEIECHSFPPLSSLISILPKGKTVYFSTRRVWLNKLGLEESSLDKNSGVCSLHFLEQDFETKGELQVLKENAIPSQKLPPNLKLDAFDFPQRDDEEQESETGNAIETVEKNDSDEDDIEIIEPQREIITLDDDGCEEKDEEVQTNGSSSEKKKTESIQDIHALAIRSKFGSNLKAGDYTNIRRTVNSMVKPTEGHSQNNDSQTIITTDGKKFVVQEFNTVLPKGLPQFPIAKNEMKFANILPKEISKIPETKEKFSPMMLSLSNASKLPLRIVSSKSPDSSPRTILKRIGSPENETKITTPKKRKSGPTSLPKSKIKKIEPVEKKQDHPVHSGDVKLINIDQLLKKDVESGPVEGNSEENAKGFSEIHDFINKNVINFRFEFLGTTYVLKECVLNFSVASNTGLKKCEFATAIISNAPLYTTDDRLLNGMNVSLGLSKTFDPNEFTKIVSYKQEILRKKEDVPNPETNCEAVTSKTKKENNKRKYNKKKDVGTKVEDKVVINPANNKKVKKNTKDKPQQENKNIELANVDSSRILENKFENLVLIPTPHPSDATTGKCLDAKSLKIDDKERKVAKTSRGPFKKVRNLMFGRKSIKMPISQMNPQLNHVVMPNGKLKRNRRTIFNNLKEKDEQQAQGSYNKTIEDTISEFNAPNDKNTVVTTTRSSRQKVKKNYRNINRFGLMEEPTNIDRIPRKKIESSTPTKRSNYSETVGRIESFLEVVLEPQPNDDNMDVDSDKVEDGN